ncbi:unnamed protein product [Heligmosomoides polygyrus]|uniref:HTH_48 domain-containing protein n=1 Tax=Heligmosomoides polygyrus TaxID=6339 RepID=A0A183FE77_HELPZ|nr:unnamed protein product [Heligmosomoides polygyrus]
MARQISEEHIRHCMLFEFRKGSNATVATKNICDVYPDAMDVRKCQRWFSRFKSGNFDLSDSSRSGRPVTFDNDMRLAELGANRLNQALLKKYPAIVNRKGVILHHDNARQNCAKRKLEEINELGWEVLPHPPYSPVLTPSDYHLYRSLQHFLSGKKFESLEDIQNAMSIYFAQKPQKFYCSGIEDLLVRWRKVVDIFFLKICSVEVKVEKTTLLIG